MDHDPFPAGPPLEPPTAPPPTAQPDPTAPPDPTATAAAVPAAEPTASTNDEWFGPRQPRDPDASPRSVMTWLAAGVSAAVIAAAAVIGIHAATSHASASPSLAPNATTGTNGSSGANGTSGSGSASGASGASGGGGGFGQGGGVTFGTITATDGSTLTLSSQSGTATTVKTTSSTVVTTTAAGTVDDISKGDHLVVIGTTSGAKVVATRIVDRGTATDAFTGPGGGPPSGVNGPSGGFGGNIGGGGFAPVTGTVTAVDGSTVTLATSSGTTVTVTASSTTAVEIDKTITVSQLKTGEQVVVSGTTSGSTVTATRIREGAEGIGNPGFRGRGSASDGSANPAPGS